MPGSLNGTLETFIANFKDLDNRFKSQNEERKASGGQARPTVPKTEPFGEWKLSRENSSTQSASASRPTNVQHPQLLQPSANEPVRREAECPSTKNLKRATSI